MNSERCLEEGQAVCSRCDQNGLSVQTRPDTARIIARPTVPRCGWRLLSCT